MRKCIAIIVALLLQSTFVFSQSNILDEKTNVSELDSISEISKYETKEVLQLYNSPSEKDGTDAFIEPQVVFVLDNKDDWYLIKTWIGSKWINISGEIVKYFDLEYITAIYKTKNGKEAVGYLAPQRVKIIEDSGQWIKIQSWLGEVWFDGKRDNESGFLELAEQTELYNKPKQDVSVGTLAPQTVKYLESKDNWYLIETWIGQKWIYVE